MNIPIEQFDAVAFDFDGTLADTHPAHIEARAYAFREHDIRVTPEIMATAHREGNTPTTIIAGALKAAGLIPPEADPYANELVQQVTATKNQHYAELARKGFQLHPGALRFMNAAAEAYGESNLVIVTTAPLSDVAPTIALHGLDRYISDDHVVTKDIAEAEGLELKPAPDQYVYASKLLGVAAARLLVIEDTKGGVRAGHDAGCPVAAVGTTSPREALYVPGIVHPDFFASSFDDLMLR